MYRRTYLCVLCCAVVCESMCSERFVLFWFTKLPHCTELISIANLNIVVLYTYPHTYVFLFVVIVIRENGSPVVIMAFATSTTSPVLGCCSTALLVFTSSLASHNKTHKQLWGVTAASRNESCSNDDDDVDGDGDGKDASSGGSSYKNAHSQMCRLQSQRMHTHTHTSARGYNAHTQTQTRLSAEAGKKFRKACKKYIVLRVRERERECERKGAWECSLWSLRRRWQGAATESERRICAQSERRKNTSIHRYAHKHIRAIYSLPTAAEDRFMWVCMWAWNAKTLQSLGKICRVWNASLHVCRLCVWNVALSLNRPKKCRQNLYCTH